MATRGNMNNKEKFEFYCDEMSKFEKCASCPDAGKIKKLYKKNENICKKLSSFVQDIEKIHFDVFTSYFSANRRTFANNMKDYYREKIEEIMNNDGNVEELKKLINRFETSS